MSSVTLRTMVGDYPNTAALKSGQVVSSSVKLEFTEAKVPHDHFKQVIKGEYDAAELAIMTYLQAKGWGRELIALPVVMHGRFQHAQIAYNAERGTLTPADLPGKRVGVRTYSQTTPTWVRGILQNDYGVDLSKLNWVTFDDGHVPEFRDPPNATRAPAGKKLLNMLLDGEVDAAVLSGADLKHPGLKPLIADPKKAAAEWHRRHGVLQINHIFVVKESLARDQPEVVKELYRLFVESKKAGVAPVAAGEIDDRPIGFAANRRNFEIAAQYAWQQRLIPRELKLDDLFDATTRSLGA